MKAKKLKKILTAHKKWIRGEGGKRIDLRWTDLQGAYLQGADLQGADLQGADLQGAYLQGAYLQGADLRGAYLQGADLRWTDLQGADLQEVNLFGTIGNMKEVKSLQIGGYPVTYTATTMQIGCEQYSIEDWWGFSDKTIALMDLHALSWWTINKPVLQAIISAAPASR